MGYCRHSKHKVIEYNEHFFPGIRANHRERKWDRKSIRRTKPIEIIKHHLIQRPSANEKRWSPEILPTALAGRYTQCLERRPTLFAGKCRASSWHCVPCAAGSLCQPWALWARVEDGLSLSVGPFKGREAWACDLPFLTSVKVQHALEGCPVIPASHPLPAGTVLWV